MVTKNVDRSHWTDLQIGLSRVQLIFRVPDGYVAPEMPVPPPVRFVDLDRDIVNGKGGVGVFWRVWSYRGFFGLDVEGRLFMAVAVRAVPLDMRRGLADLDDLERISRRRLDEEYRHKTRFAITVPSEYRRTIINGRPWLSYSLGGWKDATEYATIVRTDCYVVAGFDFIRNVPGKNSTWRKDAQSVADEIVASFELREFK